MAMLPGIVQVLFNTDTSHIRFEHFCLDICGAVQGIDFVPTSRTWDLGRDGRTISASGKKLEAVLCATLETDIDPKVEADVDRLRATTQTKAIFYCSSRPLTEKKCDEIGARIREIYPGVESVVVLGQHQLGAFAERFEDILRRHYAAEIRDIEEALFIRREAPPQAQDIGLRLALMTQVGQDAWELRRQLSRRLVLDALLERKSLSAGEIAVTITAELHLPRAVSGNYIRGLLDQLAHEGLVAVDDGVARLTAAGEEAAATVPAEAGAKLLEGRVAVREAIRTLSGHVFDDGQFDRMWNTLQDGLAEIFYTRGITIVRMVRSLLAEETPSSGGAGPVGLLENLGDRVAALFVDSDQAAEVRQAVIDMFSEKESAAFDWLANACSVYVMMCSLGFEAVSSRQTTAALARVGLVPDSDVVISLLCEGEDNHDSVERILSAWRALGGKVLMTRPVLEEVSHHAWISERDYSALEHQLAHMSEEQARRYIENAFVRAFRKVAGGSTARRHWNRYIQQYRGNSEWDYSSIMELLREDHGFGQLPDAGEDCAEFIGSVTRFLVERASQEVGVEPAELNYRTRDKCGRDTRLLAAVLAARRSAREGGHGGSVCVVSSAGLIAQAAQVFGEEMGQPEVVLCTAALSLLMTLTPGVPMGVSVFRFVLFDDLLARKLAPALRYAYRLILESEQYDVPWAKRVSLAKELRRVILREAQARGEPVKVVRDTVLRSDNPELSAQVVARALDSMAVTPKERQEIYGLRQEVKKLREELEAARESQKVIPVPGGRRLRGLRRKRR